MSQQSRMHPLCAQTNALEGTVFWSPAKSLWYSFFLVTAIVFAPQLWSWQASLVFGPLTSVTLCAGHSIGFHRLLNHRSFCCPKWLEKFLVTLGTFVGMGGPAKMLYLHEIRDWSQRKPVCHPFFIHQSSWIRDWCGTCIVRFGCCIRLSSSGRECLRGPLVSVSGPQLDAAADSSGSRSVPSRRLAIRGLGDLCANQCFTHRSLVYRLSRPQSWSEVLASRGHAVQGYNVPGFGLLSMGEAWHNNHHAFPESARFGLEKGQNDPGWWLLCVLRACGLVWNLNEPEHLPHRPELSRLTKPVRSESCESRLVGGRCGVCSPEELRC